MGPPLSLSWANQQLKPLTEPLRAASPGWPAAAHLLLAEGPGRGPQALKLAPLTLELQSTPANRSGTPREARQVPLPLKPSCRLSVHPPPSLCARERVCSILTPIHSKQIAQLATLFFSFLLVYSSPPGWLIALDFFFLRIQPPSQADSPIVSSRLVSTTLRTSAPPPFPAPALAHCQPDVLGRLGRLFPFFFINFHFSSIYLTLYLAAFRNSPASDV